MGTVRNITSSKMISCVDGLQTVSDLFTSILLSVVRKLWHHNHELLPQNKPKMSMHEIVSVSSWVPLKMRTVITKSATRCSYLCPMWETGTANIFMRWAHTWFMRCVQWMAFHKLGTLLSSTVVSSPRVKQFASSQNVQELGKWMLGSTGGGVVNGACGAGPHESSPTKNPDTQGDAQHS